MKTSLTLTTGGCLTLIAGLFAYASASAQSLNQLNFQAHSGYEITTGIAGQNLDITTKATDGGGIGIGPRNSTSLFIDTAGNVGIGTTSPTQLLHVYKAGGVYPIFEGAVGEVGLRIKNNQAAWTLFVDDSTLNNMPTGSIGFYDEQDSALRMILDGSGNVGIATNAPADKLHVAGNATISGIANCTGTGSALKTDANGRIVCGTVSGGVTGSGAAGQAAFWTGTGTLSGDSGFTWDNTNKRLGLGTTSPNAQLTLTGALSLMGGALTAPLDLTNPAIYGTTDNTAGGSTYPFNQNGNLVISSRSAGLSRDILFRTYDGSTADYRAIIKGSGNIGIGTTGPADLLHLYGSNKYIQVQNSNEPSNYYFRMGEEWNTANALRLYQKTNQVLGADWSGANMFLMPTSGNVGIGTTSPTEKLSIASGGIIIDSPGLSASSELGLAIRSAWPATSWARGFGILHNNNTIAASFGVVGNGTSTLYAYIGPSFSTTWIAFDAAGNTGIGTSSPNYKLDVRGTGSFTQPVIVGTPTAASHAATKSYVDSALGGFWSASGSNIYNSNSGNIGIGTTSPAHKLDITGSFYSRLVSKGNCTGAVTIDWNAGNTQHCVLTGNVTFTFSNGQSGGNYRLILKQDGTGNRTVTWPGSVRWGSGGSPSLTATAGKTDYVGFFYNGVDSTYDGNAFNAGF